MFLLFLCSFQPHRGLPICILDNLDIHPYGGVVNFLYACSLMVIVGCQWIGLRAVWDISEAQPWVCLWQIMSTLNLSTINALMDSCMNRLLKSWNGKKCWAFVLGNYILLWPYCYQCTIECPVLSASWIPWCELLGLPHPPCHAGWSPLNKSVSWINLSSS